MASLSPTTNPTATATATATATTKSLFSVSHNPLSSKPSQLSAFRSNQTHRAAPKISCNAAKNDEHQTPKNSNTDEANKFDRRNMLIGLGGLYGAATTLGGGPAAIALPTGPEVTQCEVSTITNNDTEEFVANLNCCPRVPDPSEFVEFKLPSNSNNPVKIRPAAHLVDDGYVQKYWKALERMKALPDSDPRSFKSQANVHCAYCNGGYNQVGLPAVEYQVHGSWLFFPFHRAYLYFFERILGSLIDDPNFAIPYWNWDHPNGMVMPSFYNIPNSPFFNPNRNQNHLPYTVLDLEYDGAENETNVPYQRQIRSNLVHMYRQMMRNSKTASQFLGGPYRAGEAEVNRPGQLENSPHNNIHDWVGNPKSPNGEDMGHFYSAGRDPIFYAHHANVDRTWSIWNTTLSPNNKSRNFKENDFLNSFFYFYDENAKPVKISVKDVLDTKKMGYDYQPMDLPWLWSRPIPGPGRGRGRGRGRGAGAGGRGRGGGRGAMFTNVKNAMAADNPPVTSFPKPLDKVIWTNIKRPSQSRSKKEKEEEEEILIVEVESKMDVYSKFDVFVNDEDDAPSKENRTQTEHAGSFVNVPHNHKHGAQGNLMTTNLNFGLTELMEDLGADDDEGINVTFVPRTGTQSVVIKDVRIELLKID